ncbi:MAG: beta-N-acetylhexosaminidase [Pigmentiphaga sp.]
MKPQAASNTLSRGPVIIDVHGFDLTDQERDRLLHPLVGGVILFARNFQSRDQLRSLTDSIRALPREPLLIAVDHEGGRVQRFKMDGFTVLPPMARLGEVWNEDMMRAMQLATDVGRVMAGELRACGVDLSFAPVLDLDYGESRVIRDRSFHRNPQAVTMLARSLIQGMALEGMAACGKHFPGHGFVEADSHLNIPYDDRSLNTILNADALPYRWLGDAVLPAVMPAHVIYPQVDERPAGFSSVWLQDVLRKQLNYQGVVFSDDLTMEGASVAGNIVDRARAALDAGCDMVLVCNRPDLADQVLAGLDREVAPPSQQRVNNLMPRMPAAAWEALDKKPGFQLARQSIAQWLTHAA